MKNKISGLLIFLAISVTGFTQDQTVKSLQAGATAAVAKAGNDTSKKNWKKGGLFTLNIAQGSLDHWVGGGDDFSFSAIAFLNLHAYYKKNKHSWDNNLDLGYGVLKTTSLGQRKSDDRVDLLSKYGYALSPKWNAGVLFNFRSQFAKGYSYSKDAGGNDVKKLTSAGFAPAYVLLSVGFDFVPNKYFSVFVSPLTERWVIVTNKQLSGAGAYGVTPGKKSRNELGAFLSAKYNREIVKNVTYSFRADLFSNYKDQPQNVDVFCTNILAMKINKLLAANVTLDLLYDDDAIGRLQVRQLLGVGLSAKF